MYDNQEPGRKVPAEAKSGSGDSSSKSEGGPELDELKAQVKAAEKMAAAAANTLAEARQAVRDHRTEQGYGKGTALGRSFGFSAALTKGKIKGAPIYGTSSGSMGLQHCNERR